GQANTSGKPKNSHEAKGCSGKGVDERRPCSHLRRNSYHRTMAVVHMSEAEVVKDIAAVLAKIRQGLEVVVEQDHRTVAVIKAPQVKGRKISEVIAAL